MFTQIEDNLSEKQINILLKETFGIRLNKYMSCTRKIDSTIALHNIIAEQYSNDKELQQNKPLELLRIEQQLLEIDIAENKPSNLGNTISISSLLFVIVSFFVSMGTTILALSVQLNTTSFQSALQIADSKKDLVMTFGEGTAKLNSSFSILLNNMHIWPIIFLVLLAAAFSYLKYTESVGVIRRSAQRTFYTLYKNIINNDSTKMGDLHKESQGTGETTLSLI